MRIMRNSDVGISAIVGGGICVSSEDGHRVHDVIKRHLDAGHRVTISFSGITRITTAFLNAAVGQLYGEYTEEDLRRQLAPVKDASDRQLRQLKLVVDRAKIYFRNPESAKRAFLDVTGMDDDKTD